MAHAARHSSTKGSHMAQLVRDVMTPKVVTLPSSASIMDAARKMKENDIGDIVVLDGGRLCGIVTDRDIVVRGIADGTDPKSLTVEDVCSSDVVSVSPDDEIDRAVALMRDKAIRRLPVMEDGVPIGIVSLGDLAQARDQRSALGQISTAPANR
jgi:CBS domain-containing protein